jgi:ABC-2 type transport system permease protein
VSLAAQVGVLGAARARETANRVREAMRRSRFRVAVVTFFSALFWWGLYRFFVWSLIFVRRQELAQFMTSLIETVFHSFFFALTLMLIFSNAIIAYASYYRSRETGFLLTGPLQARSIVLYKYLEALLFSSWAFLFIGLPLMAAYAKVYGLSPLFVAAAMAIFFVYMFIPASIGTAIAMLIANFFPRGRKAILTAVVLAGLGAALLIGFRYLAMRHQYGVPAAMRATQEILEGAEFSRRPFWPSTWMARSLLALSEPSGSTREAGFFVLLILSNALFLTVAVLHGAETSLRQGWFLTQGARRSRRVWLGPWIDRVLGAPLTFLAREVRLIVLKDFKSFIRDPVQSSQFLIFFGLLAVYFVNLRSFHYQDRDPNWRNLIAQLNLLATCLTLATFAGRFVFPQVSLEGRRFWVLGMIPMDRDKILYGKLALCFFFCLLISQSLIAVSSVMLRIPMPVAILQSISLLGICLGVSGMSVGFGSIYPNFREDDPSKIVSGFGGTLNLVLMLGYVLVVLLVQAVPCVQLARGMLPPGGFQRSAMIAMGLIGLLSLAACFVPMSLGLRAIRKLEI